MLIFSEHIKHYVALLAQRYDLYLRCCPYCRHHHLIRWGYYQRQGKPLVNTIAIQRVRCKRCGRTTNVLPSFLLAYRSFAVRAAEQLVTTYINHPDDWPQALKLMIELSTAYRWLRRLSQQANRSLADIRKALVQLKPHDPLIQPLKGPAGAVISQRDPLQQFIRLAQQLFQAAVRLIDPQTSDRSELFCFLNYFLATQTGQALLQR